MHRIKQLKIYSTITYKKIINKKVCLNYSQLVTFFYKVQIIQIEIERLRNFAIFKSYEINFM